jgi:hypothetical protein
LTDTLNFTTMSCMEIASVYSKPRLVRNDESPDVEMVRIFLDSPHKVDRYDLSVFRDRKVIWKQTERFSKLLDSIPMLVPTKFLSPFADSILLNDM